MSPRNEHDEEFADFELVNDGAFDYANRKQTLVEPTKSSVEVVVPKTAAVQVTPIATDMDKVKNAIVELQGKVMETSAATAGQFRKIQTVVDNYGAQLGEQRKTQDRRMRTLEFCFNDYESDLEQCTHSIAILKNQLATLQAAAENHTDVSVLRKTANETAARCIESASRLDFMVGYHVPSIEQNIKAIENTQKERDVVSTELRRTVSDIRIQLGDLTEMNVADVRKLAEDAELRSKDVQSGLCHLIQNLIPVLEDKVHELAATAAKAFKDSTAAVVALSSDVQALQTEQSNYRNATADDIENLATVDSLLIDEVFQCKDRLRDAEEVIRTLCSEGKDLAVKVENMVKAQSNLVDETSDTKLPEEVLQHLVGKVVPLLTSRVQEQQELLEIANKAAAEEKMKSAEREAELFRRIKKLEELTSQADTVSLQNLRLHLKANCLEMALNELTGEVRQIRLQEQQKAQSWASITTQTEGSTLAEAAEELIDEEIEEIIEEEIEEEVEITTAALPKPPRCGTFTVHCKTLLGDAITVTVPPFVSIRYLKQLIYFKSGCTMHPTAQSLVYAGKVLQDGWKVGGGMFTVGLDHGNGEVTGIEEFRGIKDGSTVLIVVKRKFLE